MTTRPKKKLCWNCEGNVNLNEELCPYCGVAVSQIGLGSKEDDQDSQTETYRIPSSPYAQNDEDEIKKNLKEFKENSSVASIADSDDQTRPIVITMALMMTGGVFFLFGWVLLLFASHGYLQLRWSDDYWYIYILLALPMLFFGIRNLQNLRED